jgi:hypothetical protein
MRATVLELWRPRQSIQLMQVGGDDVVASMETKDIAGKEMCC